jgi:hypothetical protein
MRGELAIAAMPPDARATADQGVWPVIGFCLIGLAMSIFFAASLTPLDQVSLLIIQSNLF